MKNNILQDIKNKKLNDWAGKKKNSLKLAKIYNYLLYHKKSLKVSECANILEFKEFLDGTKKLNYANFCKDRLCPLCLWRRSLKLYFQMSNIMNSIQEKHKYEFLFLTLTSKNATGENLKEEITNHINAFKLLTKRKEFKKAFKGFFRALEVTVNHKNNTFHHHSHVILAVDKHYFTNKDIYLSQEKIKQLWQSVNKFDYEPIIDIRKFKTKSNKDIKKSICEAVKYSVKSSDYLKSDNININSGIVNDLLNGLQNRRLIGMGGVFKEIHKILNLENLNQDNNLIKINEEEETNQDLLYNLIKYKFNFGVGNYLKDDKIKSVKVLIDENK